MKGFADLYMELDATTKTNAKVEAMCQYFKSTSQEDSIWAIALLTGKRPKRPIRSNLLREWATQIADISYWLFEESYSVVGDLAETISLLIRSESLNENTPLHVVMKEIIELYPKSEQEKKEWLLAYWQKLSPDELFVFNKLIGGSFRVGVSTQLVFKALGKAFKIEDKKIAHKLMGNWSPQTHALEALLHGEDNSYDDSRPYPFFLSYQLDVPLEDLGIISDWIIEKKFDGIRGQIIKRNDQVFIWSRGEDLMTEKFTEFQELKNVLPNGTVLDGEILPIRDNKILPFNEMQKRIGRKNLSKKILQDIPLALMCYDLLELNGEDMREKPLAERRKKLEELLKKHSSQFLHLSPLQFTDDWNKLDDLRNKSKQEGCEGLMLKHKESIYETGRRRGKWWKWKVNPYTVDAVLIYAQSGSGRRANLYTDYTFAVKDGVTLVPFTKAYSGLTDKEILQVDNWIRKNTIEKFGPVRSVKAELVFEIAFEGINSSPRHKSGVALRFPRISRWRKDKSIDEINTKQDLLQLLNAL
jgi:DNA ligase 1